MVFLVCMFMSGLHGLFGSVWSALAVWCTGLHGLFGQSGLHGLNWSCVAFPVVMIVCGPGCFGHLWAVWSAWYGWSVWSALALWFCLVLLVRMVVSGPYGRFGHVLSA